MITSRLDRAGLVERVAERTKLSARTSDKAVEAVLEEIYEALKRGECVSLKNFGTFYAGGLSARVGCSNSIPRSACANFSAGRQRTKAMYSAMIYSGLTSILQSFLRPSPNPVHSA
jgi:nucleoid DNA-binding protein